MTEWNRLEEPAEVVGRSRLWWCWRLSPASDCLSGGLHRANLLKARSQRWSAVRQTAAGSRRRRGPAAGRSHAKTDLKMIERARQSFRVELWRDQRNRLFGKHRVYRQASH